MKIIVGLGNPGANYARTRHNIGFSLLDCLASELGVHFSINKRFGAEVAQSSRNGTSLILLKPMTYMNLSGDPVSKALNFYKVTANNTLVVYDDLDLEEGKVRYKEKGGHGGHNGMRSIIAQLGTSDFPRLKIGVGRPTRNPEVADYDKESSVTDWLLKPVDRTAYEDLITSALNEVFDRIDFFLKQ